MSRAVSNISRQLILILLLVTGLYPASRAGAQDIPDPNPRPNSDGTYTWWVGNNMQYPVIQEVIDAAFAGDEIVILPGLYVEDLALGPLADSLTIRPACELESTLAVWGEVVLWNPTKGAEDDPWSVLVDGSDGSYIGRPRQFFQLANGYQASTIVAPGEWAPVAPPVDVELVTAQSGGVAMTFWSRDVESVAIYVRGGTPTFHSCLIKPQLGFGAAILVAGDESEPLFVDCTMVDFTGESGLLDGIQMQPVTIHATGTAHVRPSFRNCSLLNCSSGVLGVVHQTLAESSWTDCRFESNVTPVSDGIVVLDRARAWFSDCVFTQNSARLGTIHVAAETAPPVRSRIVFDHCDFLENQTIDGQYGGVLFATGMSGGIPVVELSGCGIDGNNGHAGFDFFDIKTPFYPFYRIGSDIRPLAVNQRACSADLTGDGLVDGRDLAELLSAWSP
ncbi:MAG: hypothetical protein VX641_06835 [Planctomycetota bacterium]|nr:hypothetical protein [Planctomycetota bacterium]